MKRTFATLMAALAVTMFGFVGCEQDTIDAPPPASPDQEQGEGNSPEPIQPPAEDDAGGGDTESELPPPPDPEG